MVVRVLFDDAEAEGLEVHAPLQERRVRAEVVEDHARAARAVVCTRGLTTKKLGAVWPGDSEPRLSSASRKIGDGKGLHVGRRDRSPRV